MDPLLIMVGIIAVPILVLSVFRINAATAFLALCLGSTLSGYVAEDTVDMLRGFLAQTPETNTMVVSLILVWLPVFVVSVFMISTIGRKQIWLNLLPALAVGLFGLLLSAPLLTSDTFSLIEETDIWSRLVDNQAIIVAVGTVISLVFLRMRKKPGEKRK